MKSSDRCLTQLTILSSTQLRVWKLQDIKQTSVPESAWLLVHRHIHHGLMSSLSRACGLIFNLESSWNVEGLVTEEQAES